MIKTGKFKEHPIKFIVGLGNPGNEYQDTFHNVGMMFIGSVQKDAKWLKGDGVRYFKKSGLVFCQPDVFMNDSGIAFLKATRCFGLKIKETLVVHDDTDLAIGSYKFSFGRGAAGHKGVLSVMKVFKTPEFWRLRVGIRSDADKKKKAGDIVLKKINAKSSEAILTTFKKALDELGLL